MNFELNSNLFKILLNKILNKEINKNLKTSNVNLDVTRLVIRHGEHKTKGEIDISFEVTDDDIFKIVKEKIHVDN